MLGENELELLSAYADGELSPDEGTRVAALLAADPSLINVVEEFRRLHRAARAAECPAMPDAAEHWVALNQTLAGSREILRRTAQVMLAPHLETQRFDVLWSRIQARTVLNPRVARRSPPASCPPKVGTRRWNNVWQRIAGKARVEASAQPVASPRAARWKSWALAIGGGVAACTLVLILTHCTHLSDEKMVRNEVRVPFCEPVAPIGGEETGRLSAIPALEVPDTLDDRYGVTVKYNPGDDSPVIHVYLKTPPDSEVRSTESVVPAQ